MTAFWVVIGIFIVVALAFVVPTLLRKRKSNEEIKIEREAANIGIYRDQLAELERDLQNDILSQEQYEASRQELQKRMLLDLSETEAIIEKGATRHGIVTSIAIVLTVPLAAISLYTTIGDTRGLLSQSQLASATQFGQASVEGMSGHAEIDTVVESLAARLKDNPEDIEGWVMLARTYTMMERFGDASSVYAKLVEMVPNNPQFLSDYADMLAMTNSGSLRGRPAELVTRALSIDPNYPKALALAGTIEFEQQKYGQAADYWERLLKVIPADTPFAQSVNESVAEARSLAQGGGSVSRPEQFAQSADTGTADAVLNDASTVEKQAATSSVPSIAGNVTLDASLAGKFSPDDTLFIFARASQGPRVPLAILRLTAKDLPVSFQLDDNMAMTPAMKLSTFPEVVVGARISKTGQAVPASGDLEGYSQPVKIGDNNISVTIDQLVP